jgi:predicted nicotinamide N-methyase
VDAKVKPASENAELSQLLQVHLPSARAELIVLPDCDELQLYLLNSDFPQHSLSAEEAHAVLNYPAYWAFCWASGQVLAAFLHEQAQWVEGKRVLDFGSGSGVAGIAAALAGAREVLACDLDPDAQRATAINAVLNGVDIKVCANFDACPGDFDVVLVADVLYDRENLPWLDRFLERSSTVLVADSRVRDFSHPAYRKLGQWESTTFPDLDESAEFRRVSIYAGSA